MIAAILAPSCILRRWGIDTVRLHQLMNLYINLIAIYAIIMFLTYYTWDSCTNILHDQYDRGYCDYFTYGFYIFVGIISLLIIVNVIVSLLCYHFSEYKKVKFNESVKEPVFIMVTIYKESVEEIRQTITSLKETNYENLIIIFVLDGISNEANLKTVLNYDELHTCDYQDNQIYYKFDKIDDELLYFLIIKKDNKGKKDSHCIFYQILNIYKSYNIEHQLYSISNYLSDKIEITLVRYMLILDCDTMVEKHSINKMVQIMNSHENYIALCGYTGVLNKNQNIITMAQNVEYFVSHLLLKLFEHWAGNVLVLSGCFTMIRLYIDEEPTINEQILNEYYRQTPTDFIEDNLYKIGEDRFLTNIIMKTYQHKQLKFAMNIKCYTNVPDNTMALIRQRIRWSNSLIACHFYLLKQKWHKFTKAMSIYIIVCIELFIILILPMLIIIGAVNAVLALTVQSFSIWPLIITINVIILNMYIIILSGKLIMLLYYIPFLLVSPLFMIIIPFISILNFKTATWSSDHRKDNTYVEMIDSNENSD